MIAFDLKNMPFKSSTQIMILSDKVTCVSDKNYPIGLNKGTYTILTSPYFYKNYYIYLRNEG